MESEKKTLLTNREVSKIKWCCALPSFVTVLIFGPIAMMVEWLLLVMIDDIGFDGGGSGAIATLPAIFIIALTYIILFGCAMLVPKVIMAGRDWERILDKKEVHQQQFDGTKAAMAVSLTAAGRLMNRSDNETVSDLGDLAQVAGGLEAAAAAGQMAAVMGQNARAVAQEFKIPVPTFKKQKWAVFLLPLIILPMVFVPQIFRSSEAKQQKNDRAAQTMQQLENAFTQDGVLCVSSGVGQSMRDWYDFTVHREEDPQDYYFKVSFNAESEIYDLTFHVYPDQTKTAEENLSEFLEYVEQNVQTLKKSGVAVNIPEWEKHTQPLPELTQQYLEGKGKVDYFKSIDIEDVKITFSYNCKDATPSNPAYLYFTIENRAGR